MRTDRLHPMPIAAAPLEIPAEVAAGLIRDQAQRAARIANLRVAGFPEDRIDAGVRPPIQRHADERLIAIRARMKARHRG